MTENSKWIITAVCAGLVGAFILGLALGWRDCQSTHNTQAKAHILYLEQAEQETIRHNLSVHGN